MAGRICSARQPENPDWAERGPSHQIDENTKGIPRTLYGWVSGTEFATGSSLLRETRWPESASSFSNPRKAAGCRRSGKSLVTVRIDAVEFHDGELGVCLAVCGRLHVPVCGERRWDLARGGRPGRWPPVALGVGAGSSQRGARPRQRAWALVHESEPARNDPNPEAPHRPTAYDAGLPR
jgi:hypothetical protein